VSPEQAKEVLLRYRPGSSDEKDPEVADALCVTKADSDLSRWFREHNAFQRNLQASLRSITPPASLKQAILAQQKVIQPRPWWRSPILMAAAAMVVLLLAIAPLWNQREAPNRFADFAARMTGMVQREYRLDVESSDMQAVRGYMQQRGSPGDFKVPPELEQVALAGGGFVRWRNQPVSMVCFRRPDQRMVYLFVMNRSAVLDPPPYAPITSTDRGLVTTSWTEGDRVYLLARPAD